VTTTILASALGLSLALNASLVVGSFRRAGAQPGDGAAREDEGESCLLDRLQLDEGQRERLTAQRSEMHVKRRAFWRRSAAIKAELADAIRAEDADRERIDSLLARYAENQAEMQREIVAYLSRVNAMLRPDQRGQFHELLRTDIFHGTRPFPNEQTEAP
jgi:Spy/CpxP family protein refolding chaperone